MRTKRVWGKGPSAASTRSRTPSTSVSVRSTSPPKSAWPGVSTMLILTPRYEIAVFFAMIVMPFSRSRSIESMIRSGTVSLARKMPPCQSIASTRVVLPWSTWAMMATLRRSGRVCMSLQCSRWGRMTGAPARFGAEEESGMRAWRWLTWTALVAALPVIPGSAEGQQRMHPTAVITMEKGGEIQIELYPKDAPKTVESFITLAKKGFYDGLTFHRVVPGFVAQGGDPKGDGTGGPGYQLKAEFNQRKHLRGTLAMARSQSPDSAGSQFYICFAPAAAPGQQLHHLRPGDGGHGRGRPHQARRQDAERQDRGGQALTVPPGPPVARRRGRG